MVLISAFTLGISAICVDAQNPGNLPSVNWIKLSPATAPPARLGPVMAYDYVSQKIVMFGGYGGSSYHSGYGYNRGYGGSLYVIPSIYLAPSGGYAAPTVYASPAASYYYGPSADLRSGYGPSADLRPGSAPVPATPTNLAYLDVRVPPDAQVWVDGDPTTQTGGERSFVSPPLEPGRIFMYEIRARWLDNGEVVDLTKQVRIRAGDRVPVDFLAR